MGVIRFGKKKKIEIHFSNRWIYTLVALGILALVGVGVYAYANPATGVGHSYTEIEPCSNGKILKMVNGNWSCADEAAASIDWSAITNRPAGLDDGDQVGITAESDPYAVKNCKWSWSDWQTGVPTDYDTVSNICNTGEHVMSCGISCNSANPSAYCEDNIIGPYIGDTSRGSNTACYYRIHDPAGADEYSLMVGILCCTVP